MVDPSWVSSENTARSSLTDRFSSEMQEIHDAMEAIRQKKEKMQEVLRKRYGTFAPILV